METIYRKQYNNKDKANLEVFSETLQELAENDRNIIVVTSDSRGSGSWLLSEKNFQNKSLK